MTGVVVVALITDLPTTVADQKVEILDIKEAAIVHPEAIQIQEDIPEDQDQVVIPLVADLPHRVVLAEVPLHEVEVIREVISAA